MSSVLPRKVIRYIDCQLKFRTWKANDLNSNLNTSKICNCGCSLAFAADAVCYFTLMRHQKIICRTKCFCPPIQPYELSYSHVIMNQLLFSYVDVKNHYLVFWCPIHSSFMNKNKNKNKLYLRANVMD